MHYKVLIVKPVEMRLNDVMYPFQELDKTQEGIMNDDRGVFIKLVDEKQVPLLMEKIYEHYYDKKIVYEEQLRYRANHTLKEFQEKYNQKYVVFEHYKYCCDVLKEYEQIKDLTLPEPRLITFIKHYSCNVQLNNRDLYLYTYIKGIGFGYYTNPRGIWDYYTTLTNADAMDEGFGFLCRKHGTDVNTCRLEELDIDRTLSKFDDPYTYVIFCKNEGGDSVLYTTDNYKFNESNGLVEDTDDCLREIYRKYVSCGLYEVCVVDIHN